MEGRAGSDATLFVVSGSNALDPLDPVFAALEQMGANMQRIGVPMHPGTLLWIASWKDVTVIGLPSCGVGAQATAFDVVLPKLLAEVTIHDEDLAALGHGGILNAGRRNVTLSRDAGKESLHEPVR
jgi:molybdopterin biosynthesis enzyme